MTTSNGAGASAPVSTPASAGAGLDAQASIEQPILDEVTMTKIDPLLEHAVRSNMRRIRETTPINGGKPLSLRRMAEILGTSSVNLSRFETGKKSPFRHEMVVKYAEVLDVPIDLFYQLEPKLKPSRQEVDLLDIANRRYAELDQSLRKTQEALRKTQHIVKVQTLLLKEQDQVLKRVEVGLKRINERT